MLNNINKLSDFIFKGFHGFSSGKLMLNLFLCSFGNLISTDDIQLIQLSDQMWTLDWYSKNIIQYIPVLKLGL